MNYSTTGFQLLLTRKMSFYIVTYYLPSGLFVVVSWIRSEHTVSSSAERGIMCDKILGPDTLNVDMGDFV